MSVFVHPSRAIRAAAVASPLQRAAQELPIRYQFEARDRTLDDYLADRPVIGFLIARGDTILVERYQYGRNDRHLLHSYSMAKSITGLLIGLALEQGAIRSIDDTAETYVPGLKGTEFGRTPVKALLLMSSGVAFNEDPANPFSDVSKLVRLTVEQHPAGALDAVKRFNTRRAPPGKEFYYSSIESEVLGLVLSHATKRTVADYASEMLWQPLGAEADATWFIDATGHEVTFAGYSATLRDWARLGLMLAHGGKWNGCQVVPESWVKASTTPQPDWPSPIYGYHIWISGIDPSRFYFGGAYGQTVLVDPVTKMVVVQTALANDDHATSEFVPLVKAARAELGH